MLKLSVGVEGTTGTVTTGGLSYILTGVLIIIIRSLCYHYYHEIRSILNSLIYKETARC